MPAHVREWRNSFVQRAGCWKTHSHCYYPPSKIIPLFIYAENATWAAQCLQMHKNWGPHPSWHLTRSIHSGRHLACEVWWIDKLYLMFIGPCIILIVEKRETNLMSLALLFLYLMLNMLRNITPTHIESEQYNPWNNSTNKSQAPEDGCINIWNTLSIK